MCTRIRLSLSICLLVIFAMSGCSSVRRSDGSLPTEADSWNSAVAAGNYYGWQLYIRRFPKSQRTPIAQMNMLDAAAEEIRKTRSQVLLEILIRFSDPDITFAAAKAKQEELSFELATVVDTADAYGLFLRYFASSLRAPEAMIRRDTRLLEARELRNLIHAAIGGEEKFELSTHMFPVSVGVSVHLASGISATDTSYTLKASCPDSPTLQLCVVTRAHAVAKKLLAISQIAKLSRLEILVRHGIANLVYGSPRTVESILLYEVSIPSISFERLLAANASSLDLTSLWKVMQPLPASIELRRQ